MPNISFKNVSVTYLIKKKIEVPALINLTCDFSSGSINAIMGPSGSGKTSFLRALCNSLDYDGYVYLDDKKTNEIKNFKHQISYVSQDILLYPKKTIYENLEFPLQNEHIKDDEREQRILDVADLFNLTDCLTRLPKHISQGQQQKVSFAKALIKIPKILVLDECFSSVDVEFKIEFIESLKKIIKIQNMSVFFVTHNIDDALNLCDHFLVLENGNKLFYGKREEFINSEFLKKCSEK